QRESNTISGVIGVLAFSGVVIAMVDAQMAGILQRYYADFSFMFFAAIVLLVFIINENLNTDLPSKGFFKKAIKSPSFNALVKSFGVIGAIRKRLDQRKIVKMKKRSFSLYQPGVLSKSIFLKVLIAFVAIGVIYSVLLCFAPETGWYSDTFPWAYQDILENISFWK
ncbi:MAG: hypothetical protein HUJ98_13980, partial [Bacteroidaceae bacterium]|nr:hypothetical protein [Bacteroidaceae bacterium]